MNLYVILSFLIFTISIFIYIKSALKIASLKLQIEILKENNVSINKRLVCLIDKVEDIKCHTINISEYCNVKNRMIELIEQHNAESSPFDKSREIGIKLKKIKPKIEKNKL